MFLEPRIPPNTGNAIRMVAGTGATLHLVEPLGFDLAESKLKRAGLDYHDLASVVVHPDLGAALDSAALASSRVFAFTAHATRWHTDVAFEPDDVMLFGPEPTGLPPQVLDHQPRRRPRDGDHADTGSNRTRSPGWNSDGGTRPGSKQVTSARPMRCHPPGVSSG